MESSPADISGASSKMAVPLNWVAMPTSSSRAPRDWAGQRACITFCFAVGQTGSALETARFEHSGGTKGAGVNVIQQLFCVVRLTQPLLTKAVTSRASGEGAAPQIRCEDGSWLVLRGLFPTRHIADGSVSSSMLGLLFSELASVSSSVFMDKPNRCEPDGLQRYCENE